MSAVYCKCLEKIRDDKGIIVSYRMVDFEGHNMVVDKQQVKDRVADGSVIVTNLQLTKDGKLIDRSVEEETLIMRKLTTNQVSDADERQYNKGKLLGVVPEIGSNGGVTRWPDSKQIRITPNVKYIGHELKDKDVTLIFEGNNEVKIDIYGGSRRLVARNIVIRNQTVLNSLIKYEIMGTDSVVISIPNTNDKVVEVIFRTYKDMHSNNIEIEKCKILIDSETLDKDVALKKMDAILKRQKPSSKPGRRAYDLAVYMKFILAMTYSYKDIAFMHDLPTYCREYVDIIKNNIYISDNTDYSFLSFAKDFKDNIEEQTKELKTLLG